MPQPRRLQRAALAFALLSAAASTALAQSAPQGLARALPVSECGNELSEDEARLAFQQWMTGAYTLPPELLDLRAQRGAAATLYVPLYFHVVRDSSGQDGLSQARLDQALLDANVAYAGSGIQFWVLGQDTIDDTFYHSQMSSIGDINALRQTNVVPEAINIWFVDTFPYCGISSFTFSPVQGIVMNNNCTALPTNRSTFPHEIGHYLDLFHTHETAYGPECVDGSNCAFTGDLVCDTPADPNVLGEVSSSCVYTGFDLDPCSGAPYDPPVTNFMSYSTKPCRDMFTAGQRDRALATLVNLRSELASTVDGALLTFPCDPAVPNSTGQPAKLTLVGSAFVADGDLTLVASQLPPGRFTMFVNSTTVSAPTPLVGSTGELCLGSPMVRHDAPGLIVQADASGGVTQVLDLGAVPTVGGAAAVLAGESRTFQLWFRDTTLGGAGTSNLSNAVTVEFR